mmetsp:Transcript_12811/g.20246  ORF Transcript_12811/g.20246 Transcript_12811/m.20246 type:complete len:364 (-) Transcript_12811:147-1238(-)
MRDAKRVHLRLSLVRTIQEYLGVFFYGLSVALLLGVLTVLLFGDSGTDTIRVNAHQTTPSKSVSSKKSVNDGQGSGGNGGGEECEEWIGMISKPFRDMRSRQLDLKPMFTSQMGQDIQLLLTLRDKHLNIKRGTTLNKKVFIDLAAAWPRKLSNTYVLGECFGWSGLCIEGDPEKVRMLRQNRSCIVIPKVVCDKAGKTVRFTVNPETGTNGIVGLTTIRRSKEVLVAKCTTMDLIFQEYLVSHVDFLSLDVEGAEAQVLKGWTSPVRAEIVLIETLGKWPNTSRRYVATWLDQRGYLPMFGHNPLMHPSLENLTASEVLMDDARFQEKSARWGLHDVYFVLQDSPYLEAFQASRSLYKYHGE